MSKALRLAAPAKINLSLETLAKRADGYHEVRMLMAGLDLADELSFKPADELRLTCDLKGLDLGAGNLVMKAALALQKATDCKLGAHIHLKKRIPLGGGLAGGSTDAAAALRGLNRFWALGLSPRKLAQMAAGLGSDVPFCLNSGWAIATGRGEKLKAVRPGRSLNLVLVNPGFQVSTPWVYQNLKLPVRSKVNHTARVLKAVQTGDWQGIYAHTVNHLEAVTRRKHGEIEAMEAALLSQGARVARMSGSGPSVFGLFKDATAAQKAAKALRKAFPFVLALKTIDKIRPL